MNSKDLTKSEKKTLDAVVEQGWFQLLLDECLAWWKIHEHDTMSDGEDEYNVYDDPPEFVAFAQKIMERRKNAAD